MPAKRERTSRGERDHITVCICTYKRPQLLTRLLNAASRLRTDGRFTYSALVVDNDCTESARPIVSSVAGTCGLELAYHCEPEQSISLARNAAVDRSQGEFVAFIDDDECPEEDWLLNLYRAAEKWSADGVLGPVKPHFVNPPPKWIVDGRFFHRPSFSTGTVIKDSRYTRTGNVLLRRTLFDANKPAFDLRFGRTGGGDNEFFKRKIAAGGLFVWCDEAIVYETVPADRCKRAFHVRSAFVRGVSAAMLGRLDLLNVCKSLTAVALYTAALPMLLITSHHRFMKILIKDCDHLSKLLAASGWRPVKERIEMRSEGA